MTLACTSKMVDKTKKPILLFMVELGGRDRTRIDPQLKIPGEHQATPSACATEIACQVPVDRWVLPRTPRTFAAQTFLRLWKLR